MFELKTHNVGKAILGYGHGSQLRTYAVVEDNSAVLFHVVSHSLAVVARERVIVGDDSNPKPTHTA